jgi:hypothetical protein
MAENPDTSAAAKPTTEEPKYDVNELVERRLRLFGDDAPSPHAIVGAFSTERKKHFTAAEAKKVVRAWLDREVPTA